MNPASTLSVKTTNKTTNHLKKVALTVAAIVAPLTSWADVKVSLNPQNTGETISKYIYGQFAEHLGSGIYGGIWVGEDSPIPNKNGFRNDVIKALQELQVPVIRWPGGCFADEYHWRDGIGPREQRPIRVNTHWGGVEEPNTFGTHEFFELVELLNTEAYVAGNLGTGSPQEMAEWLEYIVSNSNSTVVAERKKNGREEPWEVAFWGVGNESWGCGGNLTPEYYTNLYRHFSTFVKATGAKRPKLVASGSYDDDETWTTPLSKLKNNIDGISHHYYTLPTSDWSKKGAATGFDEKEWILTLERTLKIDSYLATQTGILKKNNPEGNIGLYLDEWGTWYDAEPGTNPGFLYQQNTVRDAIVAAVNLNIFHNYADRLHMANIAQMVNVLQAMILTDNEKMLLTPTYHVFKMYIPFQDATHIPLDIKGQRDYSAHKTTVPGFSASAAKTPNGNIVVSLVNLNPNEAEEVSITLQGIKVETITGELLTSQKMDAHNTFDKPNNVQPRALNQSDYSISKNGKTLTVKLPAKAVVVLQLNK